MKRFAIIVAGGAGLRLGSPTPKQFLLLHGKPILHHTLERFFAFDSNISIFLVLPEDHIPYWHQLLQKFPLSVPHQVVVGGLSRFASVKAGLSAIGLVDGYVSIHDGVRPLVDTSTIQRSFDAALIYDSGVAAMPCKESVRQVRDGNNKALDRNELFLIQTPQTFAIDKIQAAFSQEEKSIFTDDATVFEHAGHSIHLVDGSYQNIKITTVEDLKIAESLMKPLT